MGALLLCHAKEGRFWPWSTPSFLRFWWRPGVGVSECFSAFQPPWNILNSTRVCLVPITPSRSLQNHCCKDQHTFPWIHEFAMANKSVQGLMGGINCRR